MRLSRKIHNVINYYMDIPTFSSSSIILVLAFWLGIRIPEKGKLKKLNLSENDQQLKIALEKWVKEKRYCKKNISVDDVVQELGVSRVFLRNYFHSYMPSDFRAWRNELRIAEAKKILKIIPNIPLNEVAHLTGFKCRGNFHRQFQKITGQTPTEYRDNFRRKCSKG